jgi:putative transposase
VEQLREHVEKEYQVVFQSRQSYYDLLAAAKITRKKAQRSNPKHDTAGVEAKKVLQAVLEEQKEAIRAGELIVLYWDECHLVWDDARGYVWGKAGERVEIPMTNFRQRQTYYGVIEHLSGETTVQAYPSGDGVSTVAFVEFLRQEYVAKRLLIIWDGATYHKGAEMVEYLTKVNSGLSAVEWRVTCVLFALNAPEQNPIADIWLKGKQFIRKNWRLCNRFSVVKTLFLDAIQNRFFDFPKLHTYA